ncbi:sugar phosphate isomerase/epimerase [bacterium]|nr:sugar phosphate isomerase/epimerase [bacterium]
MKISFSTAALYPRDTIEALKIIKDCGINYAELMPQDISETTTDFAKEIIRKDIGIKVSSIHFPLILSSFYYNCYPKMQNTTRKIIDELIEAAELLGVEVIVSHGLPLFKDGYKEKLFYPTILENINYLANKANEKGINIAIENGPNYNTRTPFSHNNFIKGFSQKNIGAVIDTTESCEAKQDIFDFLDNVDKIIHLHISDFAKSKGKHLVLGEGEIDWQKFFVELEAKRFKGSMVIEPLYKYFLINPKEKIKQCLQVIKKYSNIK